MATFIYHKPGKSKRCLFAAQNQRLIFINCHASCKAISFRQIYSCKHLQLTSFKPQLFIQVSVVLNGALSFDHLSSRLAGELLVYQCIRRPPFLFFDLFQNRLANRSQTACGVSIGWITWPRCPPRSNFMIKTFGNHRPISDWVKETFKILLHHQQDYDLNTW